MAKKPLRVLSPERFEAEQRPDAVDRFLRGLGMALLFVIVMTTVITVTCHG